MTVTDGALDGVPEALAAAITKTMEGVPFSRWLGLKLDSIEDGRVLISLEMRSELVGNPAKMILHGGVISSLLDTVGGFAALLGVLSRGPDFLDDGTPPWLSTIDMRTDYLSPGFGDSFVASASALRVGRRTVVSRMELTSDADELIAVATGTYLVP